MFVDTNVIVYASARGAPARERARAALVRAAAIEPLRISRQVLREFVAVITRPQTWANAQTAADAAKAAERIAQGFDILEDGQAVWSTFVDLCEKAAFGGKQVHDAYVVATMLAHDERRLLTFNTGDFERFSGLIMLEPL